MLARRIPLSLCAGCSIADHEPLSPEETLARRLRRRGAERAVQTIQFRRNACRHLGEPTGETVLCKSCHGKVEVKVMVCAVHGECTRAKKHEGLACCGSCPDFSSEEKDESNVPGNP